MIKHQNMAVLPIAQKTCWLHSLGTISCKLVGYNLWLACLLVGYKLLVQFLACLLACWVQALGTISCLLACLLVTSSWYNNLLLACLFVGYSLVMLSWCIYMIVVSCVVWLLSPSSSTNPHFIFGVDHPKRQFVLHRHHCHHLVHVFGLQLRRLPNVLTHVFLRFLKFSLSILWSFNFILCWVDDCDDHHHPFGLAKTWDRTRTRTRQTQVNPGTYFLKLLTFPLLPHNQVWRDPHLSFKGFLSLKFEEVFFLFQGVSSFFEEGFMVQVK